MFKKNRLKNQWATLVWLGFVVLITTGCSASIVDRSDPLDGSRWALIEFEQKQPIEGTEITAEFSEGQVTGRSGCNSYFGTYEINGENIQIGTIGMTEMACLEPAGSMEQEQEYLDALGRGHSFQVNGDELVVFDQDGVRLLAFSRTE